MTQDIILFYHPTGYYGSFSNWYPCKFTYLDITYTSTEQYMMYQKAILFHDYETAEQILKETDLGKIKRLGRQVKNCDDDRWALARRQVVKRSVKAKFIQNTHSQEILEYLLLRKYYLNNVNINEEVLLQDIQKLNFVMDSGHHLNLSIQMQNHY